MEHDALTISQVDSTFQLNVDTGSIGYAKLESDDEIILWENLIRSSTFLLPFLDIYMYEKKNPCSNRKNRKCPDCNRIIYYTRKDSFDRSVGNNSVCKSCCTI